MGFPDGASHKEHTCQCGDRRDEGSISRLGKSPRVGNGNPLQYSCLEKFHGQRSLAGYSPWGHKELKMVEYQLSLCVAEVSG